MERTVKEEEFLDKIEKESRVIKGAKSNTIVEQKKSVQNDIPAPRCRGLRPAAGSVERDLWCWYNVQSSKVPKHTIQMRARWMFRQAGITTFKASDGWLRRWFKRWQKCGKESNRTDSEGAVALKICLDHNKTINHSLGPVPKDNLLASHHISTHEISSDGVASIITPSLGDSPDCSFQYLESGSQQERKDDSKISTAAHDHFQKYSRIPKTARLKEGEGINSSSVTRGGEEKIKFQEHSLNATARVSSKKKRKNNRNKQAEDLNTSRRERIQHIGKRYHPHFKERVLSYLKSHTFKETAHKFGVHQASISAWQKDKLRHKLAEEGASAASSVDSAPAPADSQFLSWLRHERGHALTAEEVCSYAKQVVSLAGGLAVVERQVRWFARWVSRLDERLNKEGMEDLSNDTRVSECRIQYPVAFRLEVAEFAAKYSQMAAVRTFNVSRKRVFEWLHLLQDTSVPEDTLLQPSDPEIQRHGSGRSVTDLEVDQLVWQWYCNSQNKEQGGGRRPSSKEVRAHAAALYATRGLSSKIQCSYGWFRRWCERFHVRLRYSTDDELLAWALAQLDCNYALTHADLQEQARHLWKIQRPDFKASSGWAIRFCKRYPKLLQMAPTVTTPLPEPLRPLVDQFRITLQELVRENALSPDAIGNMDELPLGFSAPPAAAPKRQLLLRRPGMDSCHATVVLSCLANGTLLPTMLILKDEIQLSTSDPNLIVIQQDNGVMDLACMQKWLDLVWFRYAPSHNLLVTDSFGPHCATEVAEEFAKEPEKKRLLRLIPAGCSSKLQPLEIAIKRNFQRYIDQCWERLNTTTGVAWACGQQLRLPTAMELTQWVTDAHSYVMTSRQETIRRSFLVTGLFVAENCSEDRFIENLAALPPEEDLPKLGP